VESTGDDGAWNESTNEKKEKESEKQKMQLGFSNFPYSISVFFFLKKK
jgi:hypothetical protein